MTRETKVGIVVSCSFLGLLGVVVTSKLRGELPADKVEPPAKAATLSGPKQPAPVKGWLSDLFAKARAQKLDVLAMTPGGDNDSSLPASVAPPPSAPVPGKDGQGDNAAKPVTGDAPGPAVMAPPAAPSPAAAWGYRLHGEASAGVAPPAAPSPAAVPPPPAVEGAGTITPPAPGGGAPLPDNPSVATADLGPLGVFFPDAPKGEAKPTGTDLKATLAKQKEQAVGGVPAAPPAPPGSPGDVKLEAVSPAPGEAPAPTAAAPKAEGTAPVPLPGAPADSIPSPPAAPPVEAAVTPPAMPALPVGSADGKDRNKPQPGTPEIAVAPAVKVPSGGGELQESPSAVTPGVRPAAAAVLVPVARSTTTPKPKVEVFSVEEYTVQPGDTFAAISKAKYRSDKYAEALRLFNVNDALLSDAGRDAAIKLQPGQSITVPDLSILEKRYSHVIQGLPAGGALVPATGTSRKAEFDVRPVVNLRAVPGAAPTYEVRQPGVTMREVAARTLGNGDRWNEILRLNKEYNPERALPVGVVVKLPADARVPVPVPVVP